MRRLLAITALVWMIGCGGGAGGGGGEPLPLDELAGRTADTVCTVLTDCYGDTIAALFIPHCVESLERPTTQRVVPQYEDAIAEGTLVYDPVAADQCFRDILALGCAYVDRPSIPSCDAALAGTVPPGGACTFDAECEGDAYCTSTGAACGTCQALVPSGASCIRNEQCAPSLRCSSGTCLSGSLEGAPCNGGTSPDCAGGLVCRGARDATATMPGQPGTCVLPEELLALGEGEACNPEAGALCRAGLACALTSVSGMMGVFECVAVASSGGACQVAFPGMCPADEYCDASPLTAGGSFTGTCTAAPLAGEACAMPFAAAPACAPGTHCATDGTCRTIRDVGGPCVDATDCWSALCESGTCATPGLCR